jgi:hypothetical protein
VSLEPHARLAAAIIAQARADLRHPSKGTRWDAEHFFRSWRLDVWCDLAGIDARVVRARLAAPAVDAAA